MVLSNNKVAKEHQMILLSVHYISSTFLSILADPSNADFCYYHHHHHHHHHHYHYHHGVQPIDTWSFSKETHFWDVFHICLYLLSAATASNHSKWPLKCKTCLCFPLESCLTTFLLRYAHKSFLDNKPSYHSKKKNVWSQVTRTHEERGHLTEFMYVTRPAYCQEQQCQSRRGKMINEIMMVNFKLSDTYLLFLNGLTLHKFS